MQPPVHQPLVQSSRLVTHFALCASSLASSPDVPVATPAPAVRSPALGSNRSPSATNATWPVAHACWLCGTPACRNTSGGDRCGSQDGTTLRTHGTYDVVVLSSPRRIGSTASRQVTAARTPPSPGPRWEEDGRRPSLSDRARKNTNNEEQRDVHPGQEDAMSSRPLDSLWLFLDLLDKARTLPKQPLCSRSRSARACKTDGFQWKRSGLTWE